MTTREHLEWLARHGGLIPAATVLAVLEELDGPEIVSTQQAAQLLGYSSKWWRLRCQAGLIEGAWLDGGRWRFPQESGKAYLARRDAQHVRGILRGPNRKAPTAPAGSARPAAGEARPLVLHRPATVGREPLHDASQSEPPGVA